MEIIAECGCNWKSVDEALGMVSKCAEIGVKFAKFQLFTMNYAIENNIPEYLSLTIGQAGLLLDHGKQEGVEVFFTPMYPEAVDMCERIGVNYYKIRYADRMNFKLLFKVHETKKPTFLSTDNELLYNPDWFIHLLCIPKYPAPSSEYFADYVDNFEGISDHTEDLELFKESNGRFDWFEKHVCLSKPCLEGDWSVTFDDLAEVLQ